MRDRKANDDIFSTVYLRVIHFPFSLMLSFQKFFISITNLYLTLRYFTNIILVHEFVGVIFPLMRIKASNNFENLPFSTLRKRSTLGSLSREKKLFSVYSIKLSAEK